MFDPQDSKTSGYHLFLEPAGELREELRATIADLVKRYGGPVFAPHVTLLARVEDADLHAKAKELASLLAPFTLMLGEFGGEDEYFRAFYVRITQSDALVAAHEKALAQFSMKDARPFMPHLSLFYGNVDDALRAELRERTILPRGASWQVDSLSLYETVGSADMWRKVAEYPFGA